MTGRRLQFNNPRQLLTDSDRLSALRAKVDEIASDLSELEGMSEEERRDATELRDGVLDRFRRLDRV